MVVVLEDFIRELTRLKKEGWVPSRCAGPNGAGETLEALLTEAGGGTVSGEYELKAARKHSSSTLTLFTKAPQPRRSTTLLLEKYGYAGGRERALHVSLNAVRFTPIDHTGHSLKIASDESRIYIVSDTGAENIYWEKAQLQKAFLRRFQNPFVYVKAESRRSAPVEQFWYTEAYTASGFSYPALLELLEQGRVLVDLRIGQYPDGRIHDHGTAFRVGETDLLYLFEERKRIV